MTTYAQGSYELIDHTADVGVRVSAASLEGLFEIAALAVTDVITEVQSIACRVERSFELQEDDIEALLVSWLQELLYVLDTEGVIFGRFQVSLKGSCLRAVAWGEPFNPQRHTQKTEVKAVTYHNLQVVRRASGWQAEVIFDV
jgi:SHS2 domain-containing protein